MRNTIVILALLVLSGRVFSGPPEQQFTFAKRLYEDRMYDLAAEQFQGFLRDHPESELAPEARLLLADSYYRSRSYEKALREYQDFIVNHPDDLRIPEVWVRSAEILSTLGRFHQSGKTYLKVHSVFPGSELAPKALLEAGKAFNKGDDPKEAVRALRVLIDEYQKSPLLDETRYELGLALLKMGDHVSALTELEKIKSPESKSKALLRIMKVYLEQDQPSGAESTLVQLETQAPEGETTGEAQYIFAKWLQTRGDYQRAADLFRRAIGLLPEGELKQEASLNLAETRTMAGEDSLAVLSYEEFLKDYPESPQRAKAMFGLGKALLKSGNLDRGTRLMERLQRLFPASEYVTESLRLLGEAHQAQRHLEKTIAYYREYLAACKDPNLKDEVKYRLASIYERGLNWHSEAISIYKELTHRNSAIGEASTFALARSLEADGQEQRALEEYHKFLKRFPNSELADLVKERIEYITEFIPQYPEAVKDLSRLVQEILMGRSREKTLYRLGILFYERLKSFDEAAQAFDTFAREYPDDDRADDALHMLAQSYLKLAKRYTFERRTTEAKDFHEKAVQVHKAIVRSYPESEWADDSAIFLIEEQLGRIPADTTRYRLMLRSYESFLETYTTSDQLDFALLRIGDAYRGLSSQDPALLKQAISVYGRIEQQFPQSDYADDAIFGAAVSHVKAGESDSARRLFERLLSDYPRGNHTEEARLELGKILLEAKQYERAVEQFEGILAQKGPQSKPLQEVRLLLADAYSGLKEFDSAIDLYQTILGQKAKEEDLRVWDLWRNDEGVSHQSETQVLPDDIRRQTLLGLASAYENKGQYDEAIQSYDELLRSYPEGSVADSVLFRKAELLLIVNRKHESIETFQQLIQHHPLSPFRPPAEKRVAEILFQLGNYQQALQAYSKAAASSPDDIESNGYRVVCLFRMGKEKQAAKAARAFRKRFGKGNEWSSRFEYEEGMFFLNRKQYQKALEHFQRVIKDYPESQYVDDAHYHMGASLLLEGKHDKALDAFTDFIKRYEHSPHLGQANMKLGTIYYMKGQFAEAIDAYKHVIEAGNDSTLVPDAMFNLILAYERFGDLLSAIRISKELIRRFPDYESTGRVRVKLGILFMELGRYREAIDQFEDSLKGAAGEEEAELRFHIAESYFNLGEYEKALLWYLRVAYLNPDQTMWAVTAEYKAGISYEKLGKTEEAKQLYRRMMTRYGSSSEWGRAVAKRLDGLEQLHTR